MKNEWYYWLAVNKASVACSPAPGRRGCVGVIPTPEQLLGFPTLEEARDVQRFLLTAPIALVERYMTEELPPRIRAGEVAYVRPEHPQPPTRGPTVWTMVPGDE
jgi:hypothetical protein